MTDFELMGAALDEARKAAALGEVPVGAVVAKDGEIVAAAHNTRETEKNALHHAELLAIDAACKKLGGWRQDLQKRLMFRSFCGDLWMRDLSRTEQEDRKSTRLNSSHVSESRMPSSA